MKSHRWKIKVTRNDQPLSQPASFLNVIFISCRTTLQWMGTRYLHVRPSSQKYRHFWINSLGSRGKHGTHAVPLSPIVSNIHAHSMPVSLTPTSTQLPSHAHSYTIVCTHPLMNSDMLSCRHIHVSLSCSSYVYVSPPHYSHGSPVGTLIPSCWLKTQAYP